MAVSFNGYGEEVLTFSADGVTKNYPIKMKSNNTATNAVASDDIIGVALSEGLGFCSVQMMGYIKMQYTGTAPKIGYQYLVADGNGGVKTATSASKSYKVINVDTTSSLVGFIL